MNQKKLKILLKKLGIMMTAVMVNQASEHLSRQMCF